MRLTVKIIVTGVSFILMSRAWGKAIQHVTDSASARDAARSIGAPWSKEIADRENRATGKSIAGAIASTLWHGYVTTLIWLL